MIADPAIDIGILLYWYIDEADWKEWLSAYGLELNEHFKIRMYWYVLLQALTSVLLYHAKNNEKDKQVWIDRIRMMLGKI
jgi:hypothetical protein